MPANLQIAGMARSYKRAFKKCADCGSNFAIDHLNNSIDALPNRRQPTHHIITAAP